MVTLSPEHSQELRQLARPHPELPQDLHQFKLIAPKIVNGGTTEYLHLVEYPTVRIEQDEDQVNIRSIWDKWWSKTAWATDPTNCNPRWKSASRTGQVWLQFSEAADSTNGHPYVFCLNCSLALQHPAARNIGTKHLTTHLKSQGCKSVIDPIHDRLSALATQPSRTQNGTPPGSIPSYSAPALEKEIVRVVVDNNWSFRTIERPSFQRFLRFLRPETVIISRYKFQTMFQAQFQEAKASLLSDLNKSTKISIVLDAWSAANHLSFLAIKGYYINHNWQLQEKLLDFIPIRGRHTGTSMAAEVLQVLSETKTKRRLLALTCDSAGNNSTLSRAVETELQSEDIRWSNSENTIPCLAHVINLVVQDIISHLKLAASTEVNTGENLQRRHVREIKAQVSVPNSLRKLRAICIAIDASPQRYERFIATQQHLPAKDRLSVIRDVRTRWNSTYDMCERAIKIQRYIDEWLKLEIALKLGVNANSIPTNSDTDEVDFRDLKRLRLSSTEWNHLELLTKVLKRFKDATNFLSENRKPQIQNIWLMYNRLFDFLDQMLEDLDEDLEGQEHTEWPAVVREAAEKGRAKLSKYYSKTGEEHGFLFNCATILDPTQKLTAYEDSTWDAQDKHIYRQQFLNYLDRYDCQGRAESTPGLNVYTRRPQGSEWFRKPAPLLFSQSSSLSSLSWRSNTQDTEEATGLTRQEGESYLSTACVLASDSFDILEWWQASASTYPRLAQVAKDILAVPIASVGVERVFNAAKDIIGDRRHRLSAQTIRQIMVLKNAISKDTQEIIDTGEEEAPCDELDDLFELPAPVEHAGSRHESTVEDEDSENEIQEYEVEEESVSVKPPPRKRMRPAKYRD